MMQISAIITIKQRRLSCLIGSLSVPRLSRFLEDVLAVPNADIPTNSLVPIRSLPFTYRQKSPILNAEQKSKPTNIKLLNVVVNYDAK
jgi:hypothetical protein